MTGMHEAVRLLMLLSDSSTGQNGGFLILRSRFESWPGNQILPSVFRDWGARPGVVARASVFPPLTDRQSRPYIPVVRQPGGYLPHPTPLPTSSLAPFRATWRSRWAARLAPAASPLDYYAATILAALFMLATVQTLIVCLEITPRALQALAVMAWALLLYGLGVERVHRGCGVPRRGA